MLVASAFLLVQLGYSFEGNDQVQYLLLPYREIYPNFLPGDWFTWETSHYHVTFSWIVRLLHAVSGEGLFRFAMLGAHCATLAWLAYSVLRLARSLVGSRGLFEATFALLVFGCAREKGIAEALLNHGCLLPSDMALPPFFLACAACLERRALAAGVWLGVAGFLHANFAVLGPVVVYPVLLVQAWPELRGDAVSRMTALRALAISVVACLLIESPNLVVLAQSFIAKDSNPAAIAITLFVRSPHHYDLAFMMPQDFWWAALLALVALPAFVGPYALPRRAAALWLIAVLTVLIALGLMGAGLHIISLTRLFTLRMTIPLFTALLIAFASVVRRILTARVPAEETPKAHEPTSIATADADAEANVSAAAAQPARHTFAWIRDPGAVVWIAAALFVLGMFVRDDLLTLAPFSDPPQVPDVSAPGTRWWLIAAVALPLVAATIALVTSYSRRTIAVGVLAALPLLTALWVARLPLGVTWTGARVRPARSFHFADRRIAWDPPDRELYAQTRASTPPDARILIPPGLFEYRMRARRAVYVDWKCAPMKGDEASEWKRRMLAAMGASDFPSVGYSLPQRSDALYFERPVAALLDLARQEGMTHVLVRRSQLRRSMPGTELEFTSGPYAMLRLQPAT